MVTVPIHQDTSSVHPMTPLVIDLIVLHPVSKTIHPPLPTSTTTTTAITTTTSLPPPQPQQSTRDPMLLKRIGELEQHMADLIQDNLALEERLDKHGTRLYNLENLNIPHKVSQAVDKIVTNTKSLELDYSNQRLADQEGARKMKRKRRESLRTPLRSPPSQPPPPPPPAGASGAPGTSGASGSSQMPLPPPPSSTGTSGSAQQQGETSPSDDLMQDDSILDEQVHLSDDDNSGNDHPPKDNLRKNWWKPLPEEDRLSTPEPAWTILSSNVSNVENNWASALVSTYEPPAENSLLVKIGDMTTFMNWYCQKFQMEECHKMLIDQVDWTNPEGDHVKVDVNRPLPLGGPPIHITIQTQFFFNKDLEYLRYGSKGSSPSLSISKMKAASYPDFGLELLVPEQMWIDDVCTYDISAKYGISHWWLIDRSSILTDMILRLVIKKSEHTCGF
ncbi:hypothetical protein Tco_1341844 [Tanacetum coccineum]